MYIVKIHDDGETKIERYYDLIDAANVFSIEVGGEEITNSPLNFHCVGAGNEVAQDFQEFGTLEVSIPECNYVATLYRS